jgi:DNA-binding NtrC family response regulator
MKSKILLVDDEPAIRFGFSRYLSRAGYEIRAVSTLAEAREAIGSRHYDLVVLDMQLPDGNGLDWVGELRQSHPNSAIVVISAYGDIPTVVEAMKRGVDHYLEKPVDMGKLEILLQKGLELNTLRQGSAARRRLARRETAPFWGETSPVKKMMSLAETAAKNEAVVMIRGETGVGKGVLARWIHDHSARNSAPLVDVNCSVLKGELLASELFGHARGAFTSAVDEKQGLLDVADGASLFLDEIGDMDIAVQAQFLKVIEEKRYRRLGEVKTRFSEFRLICATHHDLERQSREGVFRQDLFFRINVFPIEIPALREIREDIPALVRHLWRALASHEVETPPEVMEMLEAYPWPGNIREMKNVLERALLLSGGQTLTKNHFPGLTVSSATKPSGAGPLTIAGAEEKQIRSVLDQFGGNTSKAAAALGISRSTLYRKLKNLEEMLPAP